MAEQPDAEAMQAEAVPEPRQSGAEAAAEPAVPAPSSDGGAPRPDAAGAEPGPAAAPAFGRGGAEARPAQGAEHGATGGSNDIAGAAADWREEFRQLCRGSLHLDDASYEKARDLLEACYPHLEPTLGNIGSYEEADATRLWAVCALYSSMKLQPSAGAEEGTGPAQDTEAAAGEGPAERERAEEGAAAMHTLSELLDTTNLTVADFFKELSNFTLRAGQVLEEKFGKDWGRRMDIAEAQSNFVHTLLILNHYKKVFGELFASPPGQTGPLPEFRLGWLLFLLIRGRLLRASPDLVSCTNALLCAMILLMLHSGAQSKKFNFKDSARFSKREEKAGSGAEGTGAVDLVASVCHSYKAEDADVAALLRRSVDLLQSVLGTEPTPLGAWVEAQHSAADAGSADAGPEDTAQLRELSPEGLVLFPGLLSNEEYADRLDKAYRAQLQTRNPAEWGDVDARLLLLAAASDSSCPPQLLGAASLLPPGSTSASTAAIANPLLLSTPGPQAGARVHQASKLGSGNLRPSSLFQDPASTQGRQTVPSSPLPPKFRQAAISAAMLPGSPMPGGVQGTPCATPLPRHFLTRLAPATPISSAMTTASWLRTVVAPSSLEPGPELVSLLSAGARDLTPDVVARTTQVSHAIFDFVAQHTGTTAGAAPAHDAQWPELRRQETVKLYYRILQRLCSFEADRVGPAKLGPLLENDRFHRSLLACSAELVLASHKATAHTFPSILEPAGISAFDMDKAMEALVRHEETLPGDLKKHLQSCDERVLESLAWAQGSPLYLAIVAARSHLAAEVVRLGLLPLPSQSSQAAPPQAQKDEAATSFTKLKGEPISTAELEARASDAAPDTAKVERAEQGADEQKGSPVHGLSAVEAVPMAAGSADLAAGAAQPPAKDEPMQEGAGSGSGEEGRSAAEEGKSSNWGQCADAQLTQLSHKVLKLALVRARALCERLRLSMGLLEMVYRVIEYVITSEVQLLFRRHLDQIVLSALYGVCKVKQVQTTFKDIISQYRRQPQCKPQVFRNVFIDEEEVPAGSGGVPAAGPTRTVVTGDIIRFYNEVFVPATKSFLLHLGQQQSGVAAQQQQQAGHDGGKGGAMPFGSPTGMSASATALAQHAKGHPHGAMGSPHVPAGSPRRVSAAHNVYVSPLASAKAQSLLASPYRPQMSAQLGLVLGPNGRQGGVGVGDGAKNGDVYASPARKLAAINSRISATRRLGKLDFSDAMDSADTAAAGASAPDHVVRPGSGGSLKSAPALPQGVGVLGAESPGAKRARREL